MPRAEQVKTKRTRRKLSLIKEKKDSKISSEPFNHTSLIPTKIESKSTKIPLSPLMESNVILKHPFSCLFIGKSGSGKSTTLAFMILKLYSGYFKPENIYIISATGGCDDIFNSFNLKKQNIITSNLIEKTQSLIEKRQKECEQKGVNKTEPMLVIFEDCSSQRKLVNSTSFIQAYVQLRHLNCSAISCSHKLKAVNRMARINSNGLIVFPLGISDAESLIQENCPRSLTKDQFRSLLTYAWTPEENFERPFLFINNTIPENIGYRKGFHIILKLN